MENKRKNLIMVVMGVALILCVSYMVGSVIYGSGRLQGQIDTLNELDLKGVVSIPGLNNTVVLFYSYQGCQNQCQAWINQVQNNQG